MYPHLPAAPALLSPKAWTLAVPVDVSLPEESFRAAFLRLQTGCEVVVVMHRGKPREVPLAAVSLDLTHRMLVAHVLLELAHLDNVPLPEVGVPRWKRYHYDGDFSGDFAQGWFLEDVLYTSYRWTRPPGNFTQVVVPELEALFPHTTSSPPDRDLRALHIVASARFRPAS
mgnify:CR=1 FL=1